MAESNAVTENGSSEDRGQERPGRRYPGARSKPDKRTLESMREIEFPVGMRGYDRSAVDRYVTEVNRVIAELEISASPAAAVRHALDEVSDETRELLQRAHDTAEEITARSRSKADDRLQEAESEAQAIRARAAEEAEQTRAVAARETEALRGATARELAQARAAAQHEADEIREAAEARVHELSLSAEEIWSERQRLLENMRGVADQLTAIEETEARRFARSEPEELDDAGDSEASAEDGSGAVAPD
jgi:DivIVA domain-containing protein